MYKGNYLDTNNLVEAFCNSFENLPEKCKNAGRFRDYKGFLSGSIIKFFLLTIAVTILTVCLLVAVFYFLYKRRIKQTFKVELDNKINEALAKYYENGKMGEYEGV